MNCKESKLVLEKIKKAKRILVNCHNRPDPDSVGSALSLYEVLTGLGKEVAVISPQKISYNLEFLPNSKKIKVVDIDKFDYTKFDLFIVVDTMDWGNATPSKSFDVPKGVVIVKIDHHAGGDKFGNINLIKGELSSCAELLYKVYEDWGVKVEGKVSTCLLTGVYGDTVSFRIPYTTGESLRVASELVKNGADLSGVTYNLYLRMKFDLVKFTGEVLRRSVLEKDYGFVWSAIPYEVYEEFGKPGNKSLIANMFFGSIDEARFGIVMVEEEKGFLVMSARGAGNFHVGNLTKELGGGGHRDSSGGSISGLPFDQAVKKVLDTARKFAKAKKNGLKSN